YRMTSVIFGATCSPFLLGAVLKSHAKRFNLNFKDDFPEVAAQIDDGLFMDDALFQAKDVEEAKELIAQGEAFFAKASFSMHPWMTNAAAVLDAPFEFGDHTVKHKCLGLLRDAQND